MRGVWELGATAAAVVSARPVGDGETAAHTLDVGHDDPPKGPTKVAFAYDACHLPRHLPDLTSETINYRKLTHRAHGRGPSCSRVSAAALPERRALGLGSPSSGPCRPRRARSARSGRPPRQPRERDRRCSCCRARGRGPRRSRSASHPGRDRWTGRSGQDLADRGLTLDSERLKLHQEAPPHHAARTVPRKQDRGSRPKRQAAHRAAHALTVAHGRHPAGHADEDLGLLRRIMRPLQSR